MAKIYIKKERKICERVKEDVAKCGVEKKKRKKIKIFS